MRSVDSGRSSGTLCSICSGFRHCCSDVVWLVEDMAVVTVAEFSVSQCFRQVVVSVAAVAAALAAAVLATSVS